MNGNSIRLCFAAFLALWGSFAFARDLETGDAATLKDGSRTLRLAMSGGYRPFSSTDAAGRLTGFDADIAAALARRMGYEPKLVQIEWDGIQAGLQSGKYDLICGSMAITDERREHMLFTLPYYVSGAQVFARRGMREINGARIGVTQQTTYARYVEEHPEAFPDALISFYPDDAQIIAAFNTDKIDAFISDRIVGGFYITQGADPGTAVVAFGDLVFREACGIAARKDSPDLVHAANEALFSLIQDGTYASIYRAWVGESPDIALLLGSWAEHAHIMPSDEKVVSESESARFADSWSAMMGALLKAVRLTLLLSLLTAIIAFFSGLFVGIAAVSNSAARRTLANGYVWIMRGTPLMVQLFISYFVVATIFNRLFGAQVIEAFGAALIALTLNMTAYNAETTRGAQLSLHRRRTGMVFQLFNLFPHRSVIHNVMEGLITVQGKSRKEARELALSLLEDVGLAEKAGAWPAQLSGGQKQRVAIARALAMRPQVLLLDEVTSALDVEVIADINALLLRIARRGMTMVVVTHDLAFAQSVANRVAFMDGGRILESGTPEQVIFTPKHERTGNFMSKVRTA